MTATALSPSNNCRLKSQIIPLTKHLTKTITTAPFHFTKRRSFPSFAIKNEHQNKTAVPRNPSKIPPLVVVGSANADIYVEIDRLPGVGETISAKNSQTLAGGKGANQAACGAKLSHPTYFVGQVGEDASGKLITGSLSECGVGLEYVSVVKGNLPTGHAVVMLQADGQNSIIIVGGTNMSGWPEKFDDEGLKVVKNAGIVLLQREIPDSVNIQVAKAARNAGVPVVLDAGGMDAPVPRELFNFIDIFSPNESELGRLTGVPTDSFEQISQAVLKCHEMGVKQVLVKLGAKGSAFFVEGEKPIIQPAISAARVLDTTGAGDTFTAAFAVALVEGKSKEECLRFAAAAASLCVQVKGAIPSMPDRKSVLDLLQSV
ncbi:ribokinase-like [Pistacia vera]|uniref:ribokinase-like n=1 Tax=Pistacia vera TaxID=55513 RepID=UPI001263B480|nr:ribokinase-like [Pistacia vera]XP_031281833.1 ribokinase-like [Pistacia vera]